ncbi:hypothetical protein MJ581_09335 [Escherichia coli]|nr:hypothetical protein MJ581_09335 [Escherichia coli]
MNPQFWQPGEGYLYELCVGSQKARQSVISYPLRVGIRVSGSEGRAVPLINHKTVLFYCFGRHEDVDLRGKGFG